MTYETNKEVRAEDSADPDGLPDRRLTCASNGVNAERLRQMLGLRFDAVGPQFKKVNQNIDDLRVELVEHLERIHGELTGRLVDLETPGPGGHGGIGSGMPLAS